MSAFTVINQLRYAYCNFHSLYMLKDNILLLSSTLARGSLSVCVCVCVFVFVCVRVCLCLCDQTLDLAAKGDV